MRALDVQVGGDHYKKYKIQPMEYSMANGLDACQHTAIKYITRFRDKGGTADLEKAKHCIDLLIEFERKGVEYPTPEIAAEAEAGLYEIDFPPAAVPPTKPEGATHYWPRYETFYRLTITGWAKKSDEGPYWEACLTPSKDALGEFVPA